MKIKFKHLIALTVLLAIGQVSFGQGTTKTDSTKTGLEWWYEWWEKNNKNNGDGSFIEEIYASTTVNLIEEVDAKYITCDEATIYWSTTKKPQCYGIYIYEIGTGEMIVCDGYRTYQWPDVYYSYVDHSGIGYWTFKNLKPGTEYGVYVFGYVYTNDSKGHKIIEQSDYFWFRTLPVTISSPDGNNWGAYGTVNVSASGCVVTKWEYNKNVLVERGGNDFSRYFEVLSYGTKTTVKATIKCKTSGKEYVREFPITIKPLTLTCASTTNNWACNSTIQMNLENAPASVKSVTWTCSSNLRLCYSGYNSTYKYAHFVVSGTGTAWIKATYTYNNKTYSTEFTHGLTGLATPVINKPISGTYTPGQQYTFSVNKVSGAKSYDWQFTQAGIYSWPNGTNGNTANIIINSQPSSSSKVCSFTIKVAAKNSCGTGNYTTYTGSVYRNASRMAHKNIADADSTDMLLLSLDELNMEPQESSFIVYPNPATTELNITQTVSSNDLSFEKDGAIKTVDIFDAKGNKCASHVFNDAQTTATIDITDLANGTFVLVINKDSDDAQTCSFIKK